MNRRLAFAIGLLLQIAAVCAVFLPAVVVMNTGTNITLRTIPVDPRSLMRGDYVVLDYEIGQDAPVDQGVVYVIVEEKDGVYERVGVSNVRPVLRPGEACIVGEALYNSIHFPGIAQFFVSEGQGRDLERAQREQRVLVDVSTDGGCNAYVTGVRLGGV